MPGNRAVFEAAMKRAAEHAWSQRWDLALTDYEGAAQEFPDDIAARGNLALAHFRLGNWDQALSHYTWMLEHAPENTFILDRLIEVYRKLGRYSDAKELQVRLNALNQRTRPTASAEPAAGLPPALASTPASRAQMAEDPIPARPARRTKEELVELAIASEDQGKPTEAIQYYEQAISAGLDRTDVFYSLGLLYQQQNRHDKALALFERCLDDADFAMSATYGCGVSRRALGDKQDAARMLSLSISLIDHSQIRPGDIDELITIYDTAIQALVDVENYLQASNLATSLADFLFSYEAYGDTASHFNALGQSLTDRLAAALAAARAAAQAEAEPASPPASVPVASAPPAPPQPAPHPPATVVMPVEPVAVTVAAPQVPPVATLPLAAPYRPVTGPLADVELPERLASSYRRVTGPFSTEPRRPGTGALADDGGKSVPAAKPPTGSLASAPAVYRRIHTISHSLPGLSEQATMVQELLAEADTQARSGHLLGALDAYYTVLSQAPAFVPVHLRLAEIQAMSGQFGLAVSIVQTALRLLDYRGAATAECLPFLRFMVRIRPNDEAALAAFVEAAHKADQVRAAAPLIRRLVQRLLTRGATSRALGEAERLAAALPDDEAAQLHYAQTLLLVGQPEPALAMYRQMLAAQPRHLAAITGANVAFALLDQDVAWWQSLETMVEAARLVSGGTPPLRLFRQLCASQATPRLRSSVAMLLLIAERYREARVWLMPVLADTSVDPYLRAVMLHCAALSASALQEIKAEMELRRATLGLLVNAPTGRDAIQVRIFDHPFDLSYLAREYADLLARQGELTLAIQALEAVRRFLPDDAALLNHLAEFHLQAGRLGEALTVLDSLVAYYRNTGQLEQMAGVLDRMSALAPNNIAVKTKLIDAYLQRGFIAQARRELELRAQLQETNGKVTDALGSLQKAAEIAFMIGDFSDAFALAERMIALQPSSVDARQYLMTLHLQLGQVRPAIDQAWVLANQHIAASNHRDAIAALHQIIGLAPDDINAHHRLGEALSAIGEYAQAERVYRRLLRQDPHDAVARARHAAMAALAGESTDDAA